MTTGRTPRRIGLAIVGYTQRFRRRKRPVSLPITPEDERV